MSMSRKALSVFMTEKEKGGNPGLPLKWKGKSWIGLKECPRKISCICGLIEENFGVSVCVKTVQRVLKTSDFRWKRIRLVSGGKPDPEEYESEKKQLKIPEEKEKSGEIELWYYDESGFSLTPCVPYAWQEKWKTLTAESVKSKRLNCSFYE